MTFFISIVLCAIALDLCGSYVMGERGEIFRNHVASDLTFVAGAAGLQTFYFALTWYGS